MEVDVIIVGASLSGCTAAILLARAGWRVALLDRASSPDAYKVLCSHHIHSSATGTLHRLGLKGALADLGAIPNGMHAWTPWGWVKPEADPHASYPSHGYNIRRQVLDPLVRDLAGRTPGVTLLLGTEVDGLLQHRGRLCGVQANGPMGRVTLKASLVVGADGRHSHVATLAGCKETQHRNDRIAVFAYYEGVEFSSPTDSLIWFLDPEYGFAFPNDQGTAQLGCYLTRKTAEAMGMPGGEVKLEAFLRSLPDFPAFSSAGRISKVMSNNKLVNIRRQCVKPGLALIGDAAMTSDPIWGAGCTWAIQSGAWLADTIAETRTDPVALDKALKAYAADHSRRTYWHQFLMNDYSRGRRFNPVERLIFSAAARDPQTATHLHSYGSRHIGAGEFLKPSALLRAAKVNLDHWQQQRQRSGTVLSGKTLP